MTVRTLVWFRGKDLRVADHAPLTDAAARGEVIPLFVLDPHFFAPERARALPHRMQLLLEGVAALADALAARGSELVVVAGRSVEVVPRLARTWRVDLVVAHRWVEPFARERDRRVAAALAVPLELHEGETLVPPDAVRTADGRPFSVFTPFARAHARLGPPAAPLPAPRRLPPLPADVAATPRARLPTLAELGIARNPRLLVGGEPAAEARLAAFLAGPAEHYDVGRDRLDQAGTSRLGADLKFGFLSVRTVWTAATAALAGRAPRALASFENELRWREFSHMMLWHRPELLGEPFRPAWREFPWQDDPAAWRAWTDGQTGYPIVDAAARQLRAEGFVHNRARMVAASFLTKHLLIDYRRGEAHYLTWLADGDWAQNNAGWQWAAGSGADAQPYFRIFNPVAQGERFDPTGGYVRTWLPELAALPDRFLHAPWTAPPLELAAAGVRLGVEYPAPIVDHAAARARFLAVARQHLAPAQGSAMPMRAKRGR